MKLRKLRNITWDNEIDVLIVDEVGSEWIQQCIPLYCTVAVLPVRGCIPILRSFKFVILTLFLTIKNKFNLGLSLIEAIIHIINPKVMITFIDNGAKMAFLQKKFPNKLIISVQNGVRGDAPDVFRLIDEDCKLPVYFGFGDYEYDLMCYRNIKLKQYIPSGSLKLGLFLSKYRKIQSKENTSESDKIDSARFRNTAICFISQYRYGMVNSSDPVNQKFVKLSSDSYALTALYCLKNECNCVVAMTSDRDEGKYKHEVQFFKSAFDISKSFIYFIPNEKSLLKSYETAYSSEAIVSINSTLCFEMFGCGKKVLFCLLSDLYSDKSSFYITKLLEKMPDEVILSSPDSQSFAEKMDSLLSMGDEEYLSLTREARNYFMKCERPYTHERIYNLIKNYSADFINGHAIDLDSFKTKHEKSY